MMETNYSTVGYPTNIIGRIDSLAYEYNKIYTDAKIIKGTLLEVVKNQHVTDEINNKLRNGIIIIP